MTDTTVSFSLFGSLFDGSAAGIIGHAVDDCQQHMAKVVEEVWHAYMDASFKEQTGFYQSHVNVAQRGRDLVVNDAGVIYGFWLEGTGSRNFPVTRFKGYFNARKAAQTADSMVPAECQPILDRAIDEING